MPEAPEAELSGWKQIAAYLKVGTRTAQEWEREGGLPVRRVMGRVVAFPGELDRWKAGQLGLLPGVHAVGRSNGLRGPAAAEPPGSPSPLIGAAEETAPAPASSAGAGGIAPRGGRTAGPYIVVTAAAAAIALMALLLSGIPGAPASCDIAVNTLIAKDGQGREVWRYQFPASLDHERYDPRLYALKGGGFQFKPFCEFADIDGDGVADVLFSYRPALRSGLENDRLFLFTSRSRLLRAFSRTPARARSFEVGAELVVGPNSDPSVRREYDDYFPPYQLASVFVSKSATKEARIVVSSAENNDPNQIAVLDGNLKKVSEYWHTGHLRLGQIVQHQGADRVFLAGVNNAYHAASLVVFDPRRISGAADLTADLPFRDSRFAIFAVGTRERLKVLAPGTETCRVIFERSCVALTKPNFQPYNRITGLEVTDYRVRVVVAEGEREDTPETIAYEMDRQMNLVEAAPNLRFQQRHLALEEAGLIHHRYQTQELKPLVHVLSGCEFVSNAK